MTIVQHTTGNRESIIRKQKLVADVKNQACQLNLKDVTGDFSHQKTRGEHLLFMLNLFALVLAQTAEHSLNLCRALSLSWILFAVVLSLDILSQMLQVCFFLDV